MATQWTREKIRANKHKMTDSQLESAILSTMPEDIRKIGNKIDRRIDLTEAEELRLEEWENSPDSGVAGGLMGGKVA